MTKIMHSCSVQEVLCSTLTMVLLSSLRFFPFFPISFINNFIFSVYPLFPSFLFPFPLLFGYCSTKIELCSPHKCFNIYYPTKVTCTPDDIFLHMNISYKDEGNTFECCFLQLLSAQERYCYHHCLSQTAKKQRL